MSRLFKALITGLLIGILGVFLSLSPLGHHLEENIGLDFLFKLRKTRKPPSEVVIVSMDKETCDILDLPSEPYKWPRSLHARLIDNLVREGATIIVFDVIFDETQSPAEDQRFARAIENAGNVILCECLRREIIPFKDENGTHEGDLNIVRLVPPIPILARSAVSMAPFPLPKLPVKVSQYWTFKKVVEDTPTLPVAAFQLFSLKVYDEFIQLLGNVSPSLVAPFPRDREEIIRAKNVQKLIRDLKYIFKQEPLIGKRMIAELKNLKGFHLNIKEARLFRSLIRMYQAGDSQYLNFFGPPGTIATIPYYQVLQCPERPSPENSFDLKGKAVFVGLSERMRPEQKDGFYTAFSQPNGLDITGVEIAATAFANLLEDRPVRPLCVYTHMAGIFSWGFGIGVAFSLFSTLLSLIIMISLSILYLIVAQYQFNTAGIWFPLMIPLFFQAPLAFFGATLWKYLDTNKERQNIRKAFGYFLPEKVVDHLVKNLADIRKNLRIVYGTCLYTDAEHYTTLSETIPPKALSSFMNQYYETIFKPVRDHGGIVSDVKGDSMLAIWATTDPDASIRNQACLAALDIAKAVAAFNLASGHYQLPTRIGLHSGNMLIGTIGAIDHYEYRPVGDIVNTASRLEGLNKFLKTSILVSAKAMFQMQDFLTRELGEFLLAGKSRPIGVYELICRMDEANDKQKMLCAAFSEALRAYRDRSWTKAIQLFKDLSESYGEDGPSIFYAAICERYRKHPPDVHWDGLVRLNEK